MTDLGEGISDFINERHEIRTRSRELHSRSRYPGSLRAMIRHVHGFNSLSTYLYKYRKTVSLEYR